MNAEQRFWLSDRLVELGALLDERGAGWGGILRQAARALLEDATPDAGQEVCALPDCDNDLVQPATGRRRRFCCDAHRRAANRRTKPDERRVSRS